MARRTLVAIGGGGFSTGSALALDDRILALPGKPEPRVLFLPTASGDGAQYVTRFYLALTRRARASHLELFRRTNEDLDALCLAQDIIYVGGGNTANMLAIWRLHGFDRSLRAAYEAGVVIAGISAGGVCWFEDTVTDSFGQPLRKLGDGLGWLRGACVPHYDSEAARRPTTHALIADGTWSEALAIDEGAAALFLDDALHEVWSARDGAGAHLVRAKAGRAIEEPITRTRALP